MGLLKEALRNISYLNLRYLPITIKAFLFANPYSIGSRISARNIEAIDFFHFVRWDEEEVISRIKTELNWGYPADLNSTWRFDCQIAHLKDYLYLKTIGMTEKDDFYSKMIRENLIGREDALKRIEEENRLHLDIIDDVLSKVGLETSELSRNLQV